MLTALMIVSALLAYALCEIFLLRWRLKLAKAHEVSLVELLKIYTSLERAVTQAKSFDPEATQDREVQP